MACSRSGKRLLLFAFVLAGLFAATPLAASAAPPAGTERGSYIVRLARESDRSAVISSVKAAGGQIRYQYYSVFPGFSVELNTVGAAGLARNPRVAALAPDGVVTASTTQSPSPSWGLDRIDQRSLPLSLSYNYGTTGAGVTAYVVDTGVRGTHVDFGGRVMSGYDAITPGGTGKTDCNGHGTHVAGTIGGTTYGVAKSVKIVPVRVLDCAGSGSYSGVIAGIDWAVGQHTTAPAVLNMSLGGPASTMLDDAVNRAMADGITVVVAAGNNSANACNYSPARVPSALTVGATTAADSGASFSNIGTCLDLFAPGNAINSDWGTGDTATNTLSGTSMAAPHVAGVAARYLSANATASPATVVSAVKSTATSGVLTATGTGSPNLLVWADTGTAPPTTTTTTTTTPPTTTTTTTTTPTTSTTTTTTTRPATITLTATRFGSYRVQLQWAGATGSFVDVWRNQSKFQVVNDGSYRDFVSRGTYTYRVCLTNTTTCSNQVTVTV